MSDEQRRVVDDAAVERRLRDLGPLIQRLDQIEGDAAPPAFVRDLRARLLQETPAADEHAEGPVPTRDTTQGNADRRPRAKEARRVRPAWWAVVAAAALVAALVALIVPRWHGQRPGAVNVAAGLPRPNTGDLTRGYPPPPGGGGGGGGGVETPTMSPFGPDPVPPYYGPLRLTAGALPRMASRLPAYQLDAPLGSARLAALARRMGIPDRVARTKAGGAAWLVAANGTGMPGPHVPPLHSLAVSTATGEVIFHDLRYKNVDPHLHVPTRARAIADARAWLARLGWPGQRMPVLDAKLAYGIWTIDLGWPGIGASTAPAATVEITPGDHVDDARLWPPLARSYHATARAISGAWDALQKGKVPLAITEINPNDMFTPTGGHGMVQRVDVVQVLVPGAHGRTYLVPAYRFAGTAHLTSGKAVAPGPNATWYALGPALQH